MRNKDLIIPFIFISLFGGAFGFIIMRLVEVEWLMIALFTLVPLASMGVVVLLATIIYSIESNIKEVKKLKKKEQDKDDLMLLARETAVLEGYKSIRNRYNYAEWLELNKKKEDIIHQLEKDIEVNEKDIDELRIERNQLEYLLNKVQKLDSNEEENEECSECVK
jgi:uncharacterized membrane protein YcjF (UPF0283 family)